MKRFRVLLDECVDRRLANHLTDHDVRTVPEMGWAGIHNGELLGLAQSVFDVFVTVDKNLSAQQNLATFDLAVIILRARSNSIFALTELVPRISGGATWGRDRCGNDCGRLMPSHPVASVA